MRGRVDFLELSDADLGINRRGLNLDVSKHRLDVTKQEIVRRVAPSRRVTQVLNEELIGSRLMS